MGASCYGYPPESLEGCWIFQAAQKGGKNHARTMRKSKGKKLDKRPIKGRSRKAGKHSKKGGKHSKKGVKAQ